jgi:Tfp pilus assembly protein PilN
MKVYLDLLPEERKQEIKRKKRFWIFIKQEILFIFPLLILLVIFINIFVILGIQKNYTTAYSSQEKAQGKYKELKQYEDQFKSTNNLISQILHFQNDQIIWSKMFVYLNQTIPEGIFLEGISTKDYQVFLVGRAKQRDNLLLLKDSLEKGGCTENVNVPLSDLVNKNNVSFQIDFTIKKDCLKK